MTSSSVTWISTRDSTVNDHVSREASSQSSRSSQLHLCWHDFSKDQRWLTTREDAADCCMPLQPSLFTQGGSTLYYNYRENWSRWLVTSGLGSDPCSCPSMIRFRGEFLGFDRPFHPKSFRLSDRHSLQSSISSFGIQHQDIKRQMLAIGSAPCLTLPAARSPRTCNPFTSCNVSQSGGSCPL